MIVDMAYIPNLGVHPIEQMAKKNSWIDGISPLDSMAWSIGYVLYGLQTTDPKVRWSCPWCFWICLVMIFQEPDSPDADPCESLAIPFFDVLH